MYINSKPSLCPAICHINPNGFIAQCTENFQSNTDVILYCTSIQTTNIMLATMPKERQSYDSEQFLFHIVSQKNDSLKALTLANNDAIYPSVSYDLLQIKT